MKNSILVLAILALIAGQAQARDVFVSGYTRQDGTYVAPYHRTSPDNNPYNNYSSPGQVNPYTGEYGTNQPYYRTETRGSIFDNGRTTRDGNPFLGY